MAPHLRRPLPQPTLFLLDSGANHSAVITKHMLFNFRSHNTQIALFDGSKGISLGYGQIIISFQGILHACHRVHLIPSSQNCVLSTGALKTFDGFKRAPHDTGSSFILFDPIGNIIKYSSSQLIRKNGLDFISC